ncbi:hypothetical protein NDU88_001051 [Pleurodeles waltl]|uniref:Uncharacterized protein n=1 Tax=Pleurodeles waltl TaxID=8319 RepID=A0AAV7NIZ7_PLEWA|nr:hypothetical protein NDU88_001051 [Pleurodeles waltl]
MPAGSPDRHRAGKRSADRPRRPCRATSPLSDEPGRSAPGSPIQGPLPDQSKAPGALATCSANQALNRLLCQEKGTKIALSPAESH